MTHRLEAMGQEKYAGLTVLNRAGDRHFNGTVRTVEAALDIPLKRRKPTMYFVNSMSDLLHRAVPFEFIDKVFAVMALCPQHVFQVLTKRPERLAEYFTTKIDGAGVGWRVIEQVNQIVRCRHEVMFDWPLPGVWLGASCENQEAADERIPHLLRCPAPVRFLSCEPLLSRIDLSIVGDGLDDQCRTSPPALEHLHWVIAGSESGPGARDCDLDWVRGIRDQCVQAGIPFFWKQHAKAGRKLSTPQLDGQQWTQFPKTPATVPH